MDDNGGGYDGKSHNSSKTSKSDDRADAAIRKLISLIEEQKITIFNEQEAAALKEVAAFWTGFLAFGRFANGARRVVMWFGVMIAAYVAIKTGVLDWFKGALK